MDQTEKYKSLLVIITGLLVLAWLFGWPALNYTAGLVGVISLAIPPAGSLIVKGWMLLAEGLGWFNARVILGIIFYVILFPIAIVFRLMGNDPLKLDGKTASIYSERNHTYEKEDLENMW